MAGFWHEERIRERAYEIWDHAGRPEGKELDFWLQAEAEITDDEKGLEQEIKLESEGAV